MNGGNDLNNTFCPLHFNHLATHPHGAVTHCCIADHTNAMSSARDKDKYYNLNNDSIHDTFNSESFRKARVESLSGQIPKACRRCFDDEDNGRQSKRLTEIENFADMTFEKAREITDIDGYIKDVQFDFVELRMGNLCNVACRTCNPASSSKWKNDYEKLKGQLSFKITDYSGLSGFKWPKKEEFWDDLFEHVDNVKVFYINGGEPTLIKEHFVFLERLVAAGKTDVKLWYNINLTILNDKMFELWNKFDNVKISCSIDDLGDRNHYIRWPTDWKTVMKNFLRLKAEPNIEVDITQTISFMNYSTLNEFYKFFRLKHDVWVHHNFVTDPSFLSPSVLPPDMIDNIHATFVDFEDHQMAEFKSRFATPQPEEERILQWNKAIEYTNRLDKIRNQNITDYLPEFNI